MHAGDGTVVSIAGVGEVSTRPAHERRGLARRLLELAVDRMVELGCALSLLHTGSAAPLYAKLGWVPVDLHQASARLPTAVEAVSATPALLTQVLTDEAAYVAALPQLQRLHRAYAAQRTGPLERSGDYWRRWVWSELEALRRLPSSAVAVVTAALPGADTIVAYLVARLRAGSAADGMPTVHVLELICADGDGAVAVPQSQARSAVRGALWTAACAALVPAATAVMAQGLEVDVADVAAAVLGTAAADVVRECHRGHMVRLLPGGREGPLAAPTAAALAARLSSAPFTWLQLDGF